MWRPSTVLLAFLIACGPPPRDVGGDHDAAPSDDGNTAGTVDGTGNGGGGSGSGSGSGSGNGSGSGSGSGSGTLDAGIPAGVITGGPCSSGAPGATAYRIRWANGGGSAYAVYEVNGLPDKSRDHTGAYGYQIGFTPSYVDPFLAQGGLQLDSSDFIDIEISTLGVSQITQATLAIYGRSYNTTASGSFNWQTFDGLGETPTNFVSNVAPYAWYGADMTTELSPGDNGVLLRIKAGPSSDALVVNRVELCIQGS
jgi:hypothetical protein